jgi:hypothetical protein
LVPQAAVKQIPVSSKNCLINLKVLVLLLVQWESTAQQLLQVWLTLLVALQVATSVKL